MSKKATTALQNPIEEILKVEDNRVSAKVLYEFLELDPTNYTRWCKTQIIENAFAEESIDFVSFVIKDERKDGEKYQPNPTTDYLLSVPFAKKLCMLSKSDKGEQARNYFIKCEAVLNTILDSPKVAATVPSPVAPAQLPASKPLPRSSQETLNYALFCLESLYHHFSRLERLKKYAFLKNDDDNGFLLCSLGQLLHIKDTLN